MSTETPAPAGPKALVDEQVTLAAWAPTEAATVALEEARDLKRVVDAADYEYAIDVAKRLTEAKKEAERWYTPLKQRLDRLKRAVLDAEDGHVDALKAEALRVTKLAAEWHAKKTREEAAAREAQERADRARAEEERRQQVARLERAAAAVPDAGVAAAIKTEAAQLAAAPVAQPKSSFASAIPQVRGFVPSRVTYSARCDDLMALARAVVEGKVPLDAIQANQTRLNQAAVDSKEALAWPGVTVLKSGAPVVRG